MSHPRTEQDSNRHMTSAGPRQQRRALAAARRAAGHTQESLAEFLGVDRCTVARWEQSRRRPHPWMRPKLATALKVTTDRLTTLLCEDDQSVPIPTAHTAGPTMLTLTIEVSPSTAPLADLWRDVARHANHLAATCERAHPTTVDQIGPTAPVPKD